MPEVAQVLEPEPERSKEEIRTMAAELRALLAPPWHLSPDAQIPKELYLDASEEGKRQLEWLKHNKLRKNWFGAVLLKIQTATAYLPEAIAREVSRREAELNRTVQRSEKTSSELVAEAERLAQEVAKALDEIAL